MENNYQLIAISTLAALAFVLQIANNLVGLQTGFGMTIDLVAVPILLALFMFGIKPAIDVLFITTLFIAIFAQTGPIGAAMKFAATAPTILLFSAYVLAGKEKPKKLLLLAFITIIISVVLFLIGGVAHLFFEKLGGFIYGLFPIFLMAILLFFIYKYVETKAGGIKQQKEALRDFYHFKPLFFLSIAIMAIRGIAMIIANFYFAGPLYFKVPPEEFISFISSADILFFGKGSTWYIAVFVFNAIQAVLELWVSWVLAYKFGLVKKYSE